MGAIKEHIRFHTSVYCASDAKFLFARDKKTINGDFYVVTFHRLSFVSVEHCSGWRDGCNELYISKVNLHQLKCMKFSHLFFKKIYEFMSDSLWYTVTLKFINRSTGLNLETNDNPKLYFYRFVITFKNFPFLKLSKNCRELRLFFNLT
jgi:hypothetical protein